MSDFSYKDVVRVLGVVVAGLGVMSCASQETDSATPTVKKERNIGDFMAKDGGYKQDAEGNWVANSGKRSSFEGKEQSSFRGKVDRETYKTGDYAKKSWLGGNEYKREEYGGDTDGSRFQTKARQGGQVARGSSKGAREGAGVFATRTLENEGAREASARGVKRGESRYVESARGSYQAPSIIDWEAQRDLSRGQSRSILGR